MDDIKEFSLSQYPEGWHYPQFKYCDALKDSPNSNRGGLMASRSGCGSVSPATTAAAVVQSTSAKIPRRRRPIGKKTTMRMSRGTTSRSAVQSSANDTLSLNARMQASKNLLDVVLCLIEAIDPRVKIQLFIVVHSMKRNMGLPLDDDEDDVGVAARDEGDDGEDSDD